MYEAMQLLLNGIVLSCLYLLLSLGMALVFGVLEIPHFAFGSVAVLGGYFAYELINVFGVPGWISIIVVVLVSAGIGVLLDVLPFRDANDLPVLNVFIIALGLLTFLDNTMQIVFGYDQLKIKLEQTGIIHFGSLVTTNLRLILIITAIIILIVTWIIMRRTKVGIAVRAVAANREAAKLMGINIRQISSFVFAYTSAIGAIVGILYGSMYSLIPTRGDDLIFFGFAAIVLAGMGNLGGTLIASLIIGLFQAFMIAYVTSVYSSAAVFGLIIVLLIFRPWGLFGKEIRQ